MDITPASFDTAMTALKTPAQNMDNIKNKNPDELKKVADDFEAMFISQMLAPMFDGLETGGMFGGGKGEEIYRSMMIQEYGREIVKLITSFTSLLKEETDAIKKIDYAGIDRLQEDKKTLARQYQNKIDLLNQRKDDMQALNPDLKEQLVTARTQFTLTLDENMRALEHLKTSGQRLVNRILSTARSTVVKETNSNYTASGQSTAARKNTLSISLDQEM